MAKEKTKTTTQSLRDYWMARLEEEDKAHKDERDVAQKVIDRYRDDKRKDGSRFNILWSNVQVLKGALYQATPKPDVRRRFLDQDKVSRETAAVIERSISYSVDAYDFDGNATRVLDDYLLPGYGQARVRYKPYFHKVEPFAAPPDEDEEPEGLDEMGEPYVMRDEQLAYEEVTCESVQWDCFRWEPGKGKWEDVNWCCIDHYLDRASLKEQFGDTGKKVAFTHGPKNDDKGNNEKNLALVHEIFDKRKRKIIVVSPGYKDGTIAEYDDPLNLSGFYPFPKPLFATQTAGNLMPIPDFHFYQDQADELDNVNERIDRLVNMLKVRGVYDASFDELVNVLQNDDGKLTPVKDFAARFGDGRDLEKVIAFMPLEEVARVLVGLYEQREQIKGTIYEITGISDIVRGQTVASETLGAQQLKGRFADMRLNTRKTAVNSFFRDLFRIKAEVLSERFTPDTLRLMTGIQVTPEMDQILKSDVLRAYKIDVETDSTMAMDAEDEQRTRVEALTSLTTFMQAAVPAVQAGLVPKELAKELALFGIRGFKKARPLEDVIERLSGENQENPDAIKMQLEQANQQIQQMQQQMQQGAQMIQQLESEAKGKQAEIQEKSAVEREKIQAESIRHVQSLDNARQIEAMKLEADAIRRQEEAMWSSQEKEREYQENEKKHESERSEVAEQVSTVESALAPSFEALAQSIASLVQTFSESNERTLQAIVQVAETAAKPRKLKIGRDGNGNLADVESYVQ